MLNIQKSELKDLCTYFNDGNWIESKDQSPEGIRLIQTGNVGNGFFKNRTGKARYISEQTFNKLKCTEIFEEDCLISRLPDPVGRSCIVPNMGEKMITAVDCSIVRFDLTKIMARYFNYYSQSGAYLNDVERLTSGTTRKRISRKNLGLVEVPLPPLSEQKRIVKILDDILEEVGRAKENAEKNLRNSCELFESYLQSVFENKGEGWKEKKLEEVANVIGGYSFKSGDFKNQGRYQVLRMGNVRPGIIRQEESPVFVDDLDDNVLKRALLFPGDAIITQTGSKNKRDYGFTVIIDKKNYLLNQRISAIRFSNKYLPKFFLYFSWTKYFKDQYFANETGTVGQGNVGIKAITKAEIPYISFSEQKAIVKKLDALSEETKKLEGIYKKEIADLEELKKSVLQKAFRGEL